MQIYQPVLKMLLLFPRGVLCLMKKLSLIIQCSGGNKSWVVPITKLCLCSNVLKFEFSGGDVRGCPISVQSSKRLGTQQKSEMPNADEVILVTKDISYFPRTLISICLVWVRYYFQFRWIGECQLWKQWKICPSTNIKFSSMKWISFTTMKCRKYCVIFFFVEVIIYFWVESS